jgi:hypothetical protein
MQVKTNLPTIPGRLRSVDTMMDGMRKGVLAGNAKMNLRFLHIVFVKAHGVDWGVDKKD